MMTTFKEILIAFALTFALVWVAADNVPDHAPRPESCSCEGRDDCEIKYFDPYGDRSEIAKCAIWDGKQSCCAVPPND